MLALYLSLLENEDDQQLFQELYNAYEIRMFHMAQSILRDDHAAEDATQELWLRVCTYIDKIKPLDERETEAYVVTMMKHACHDVRRKMKPIYELPEEWNPPAPEDETLQYEYLVELIRSFSDGYSRFLEMRYVREMTNREIAEELDMSESTVGSRIVKGRKLLKEQLEKEGYDLEG